MAKVSAAPTLWEGMVFRGVIAILFGFAAVFWPGLTLVTLVYLFSAYVLASGLIGLGIGMIHWFRQDGGLEMNKLLNLALALLEIGVGVYLLRHPLVSFTTFILLIGFVLIARGLIEVIAGLFSEGLATVRWVSIMSGVLTAVAGVVILYQPVAGGVAFVWILGLYALIVGPLLLAMAHDTKRLLEK